jgi:hypothetical protein
MLELRPNCECCDRDLPPDSPDARICTFECTFCIDCVETRFSGVCPNCGGDLSARPIRPASALHRFPASLKRVYKAHPACASVRPPPSSPGPDAYRHPNPGRFFMLRHSGPRARNVVLLDVDRPSSRERLFGATAGTTCRRAASLGAGGALSP